MALDEFGRDRRKGRAGHNSNAEDRHAGYNTGATAGSASRYSGSAIDGTTSGSTNNALDSPLTAARGSEGTAAAHGGGGERGGGSTESAFGRGSHASPPFQQPPPRRSVQHVPPPPPPRHGSSSSNPHPAYQYVSDPLLCQFLWNEEQEVLRAAAAPPPAVLPPQPATASDAVAAVEHTNGTGGDSSSTTGGGPAKDSDATAATASAAYEDYKHSYCLHFVRAFFNRHLDDSWFRVRYSPAARLAQQRRERSRARSEAQALCAAAAAADDDSFIVAARLGGGSKASSSSSSSPRHSATTTTTTTTAESPAPANTTTTPAAHLFSFQTTANAALHVTEIPHYVTDAQLLAALHHCVVAAAAASAALDATTASSGGGSQHHHHKKASAAAAADALLTLLPTSTIATVGHSALQRDAVVIGDPAAISAILRRLRGGGDQVGGNSGSDVPRKDVPRKGQASSTPSSTTDHHRDTAVPPAAAVPLEVECSDPYGRLDYDADGRGGAPSDGGSVPLRKAFVFVAALAPHNNSGRRSSGPAAGGRHWTSGQQKCVTVTLSAALSSSRRLQGDHDAAAQLAAALDRQADIPTGSRLADIIDAREESWSVSDRLDVAVAYLRRVHCFSFYHGCTKADRVADVVTGKSAVSTIHLRLQNADEILDSSAPTELAATNIDDSKDLLVQRLDDAIAQALHEYCETTNSEDDTASMERDAAAIREAEEAVKERWLVDHAITDADGRARCSFAFCHKLFKDSTFLYKHLLKKHGEFLRAEQAKCHDDAMMAAWDRAAQRPVPDILVDCGSRFGTVATPVTGAVPTCADPEPDLWRREEERRQRDAEMKARRSDVRHQNQQEPRPRPAPAASAGFVDVDDMKEEKIELSFENMGVPDPSTTLKKKKKRKLL